MKRFLVLNLWWITLVIAVGMLIAHTQPYKPIKIDHVSIILLLVIFLSPFISAIKKIKIGDFEAEIDPAEVEKLKEEVSRVADSDKAEQIPEIEKTINNIETLAGTDPVLALAKLRLELEKTLNHIYRITHRGEQRDHFIPLGKLVHSLATEEFLPKDIARTTREVVAICNRAMHGEDIRQQDAASVIKSGSFLLYALFSYMHEYKHKPNKSTIVTSTIVEELVSARYEVTTIIPLVSNPVKNTYTFDQEELDEFLETYNEYAEFIIEVVRVDS
jgi:hypothetical protein